MDSQMTYPTLEEVNQADLHTLIAWDEGLPAPVISDEWAVRRYVAERLQVHMREVLRREAPHLVDKLDEIVERMEKLGIRSPLRRY